MSRNNKGFTIIEVVITIAIGAAVMALVLNAVAGARRSQRNNARVSDVGQIAGALNDYYSNRQQLPTDWTNIDNSVENLGQYQAAADTFRAGAWDGSKPSANGNFLIWGATGTEATMAGNPPNSVTAQCSISTRTTSTDCAAVGTWTPPTGPCSIAARTTAADCTAAGTWTPASTGGIWGDDTDVDRHDFLVVVREAKCSITNDGINYGGNRRMAIIYKLEGQDGVTCRDI